MYEDKTPTRINFMSTKDLKRRATAIMSKHGYDSKKAGFEKIFEAGVKSFEKMEVKKNGI